MQAIFATYGDVVFIPVVWYWPKAASDPTQLDIVPMPRAGNQLTVREYQQKWLELYELKLAAGTPRHARMPWRPRTATHFRSNGR